MTTSVHVSAALSFLVRVTGNTFHPNNPQLLNTLITLLSFNKHLQLTVSTNKHKYNEGKHSLALRRYSHIPHWCVGLDVAVGVHLWDDASCLEQLRVIGSAEAWLAEHRVRFIDCHKLLVAL